jgi:hypothetical protein
VFQEFGVVNSTIQRIWKNRTIIFSVFEYEESRIKRFRQLEQSDVNKALLKWSEQETSGNVPMCGPLLMICFFLIFNFELIYF